MERAGDDEKGEEDGEGDGQSGQGDTEKGGAEAGGRGQCVLSRVICRPVMVDGRCFHHSYGRA
jgi:hypothetical protein